ncbi:YidH family protein [Fictibacillus aquaticus]|uniref:DUF202 domain-containing protein n=1 Tax=Fictibacillus aquaticus TaxID=2021314 RepID=A0A235F6H2_9BACL|nr:DUF202 domain-containing protein [Fictibacillus aquaticus]OYD56916.1 hypothetical protein CGZ90_15300 [Fictibacillus aquaticus]
MKEKRIHESADESKYIQQHLANERTFLAWIRTAIALAGIGFVIINLHFTLLEKSSTAQDDAVVAAGAVSFALAIGTILFAAYDFISKRNQINTGKFRSPINIVFVISGTLSAVIMLLLVSYLIYLY